MNGFDRVADGEESCFHGHRSLPPRPQEYHASLRHELQKLKNAILMPNEEFVRRYVEKRGREEEELQQKTMDVVDDAEAIPWTSCLQTSNLQDLKNTWKSGVAMRRPRFR